MVCLRCGAGNPALARFCCGCGGRLEGTSEAGASALGRPEWRQLSVFFCDVVGSTAIAQKLDPEEWHRVLQRLHSQCGELVAKHGGYVAQYLGDGLLAYFGYPVAAEDSPRRAVTAALEIARHVAEISVGPGEALRVRIGIHTGPVIVSNIGSRWHQESLALGDTPNLAARLQEVAPPGAVAISSETKRLVDGFFDCESLGVLPLKGFNKPQSIFRVVSEGAPRTRIEAASAIGLTPLIGRRSVLSALKAAWAQALAESAPAILLLTGEPGIGKSRLAYELKLAVKSDASSIREFRCTQHAASTVLYPVSECLQREIGRRSMAPEPFEQLLADHLASAGLTPNQAASLISMFGLPVDPSLAPAPALLREATLAAAAAWIVSAKSPGPRLVIIEDLHWADSATLDLVAGFVAAPPPGVLFVLTARPEFSTEWLDRANVLSLPRLDAGETRELVTSVAGNKPLPRELVERLAARSECIPLFLEEMTKTVVDSGVVRESEGAYVLNEPLRDSAIPASLHDSLTSRLDQLGHGKPVAQLGAVLGREFGFALFEAVWRRVPGVPDISLADALERVVGAQLLIRDGAGVDATYRFRHSLIQEAAYQSLLRSSRQAYHLYAAQAVVEQFPKLAELRPELVAHHYSGAEDGRLAVEFWAKAGHRATGAAAYVEATSHFNSGLDELARLPTGTESFRLEMGLRSGLGVTLIARRGFASPDVEETYARAAELCHELGDEIPLRVLYGIWAVNVVRGDLASTTRMLPGLERLFLTAEDPSARLIAFAAILTWEFWRGDYPRAIKHCREALALIDYASPKDQHSALLSDHGFEGLYVPGVYLAWSQALTGDVAAARDSVRAVCELAERIDDPYVLAGVYAFGGVIHHDLGDLQQAAALTAKLLALCQDKAFPFWQAVGLVVNGGCLMYDGDTDEALASIQRGNGMYSSTGAKTPYSYHRKYLAEAHIARGDFLQAIEVLTESLGMMRTNLDRNFEPEILRLLGDAQRGLGQLERARETLSAALDLCRSQGARLLELKVSTSLSQVLEQLGDVAEAARVLEPVLTWLPPLADFVPGRATTERFARLKGGVR